MRNFPAWHRRTMRRADRQLWGGLLMIVATSVTQVWIATFLDAAGPLLASVLTILRYLSLLPIAAGAALAAMGAWTMWRLRRDPIMLYYRCDGR